MAEKKRILLLDDSAITLELERAALAARGYQVAVAVDRRTFEAELEAFQPEIVLTDVDMPELSGQEVVQALRRDFHTERIPVVLFSAKPDEELAALAERVGADGHLSKIHGLDRLGDLLDELVEAIIW